jgi:hypothetical protein
MWPAPSWRGRHVEFARDVLGIRSLASHQKEDLDDYYSRERVEMAVCTGQKQGKTETLIVIILFDFATEAKLNGFIYGPKLEWIDEAIWPRLSIAATSACYPCAACRPAHEAWCDLVEADPLDETPRPERCSNCSPLIPSEPNDPAHPEKGRASDWIDAQTSAGGLHAPDGRAVRGYAARKLGGKGGLSGKVRFYCDESSDIDDATRDTIGGNLSGGGKVVAYGNMLYRHGWFYRAFGSEKGRYTKVVQRSSRLSPNCRGRIEWSDGAITENGRWIRFPGGTDKRPPGLVDCPHQVDDRPVRGMANRDGIEANLRAWKGTDLIGARVDAIPPAIVEGQFVGSEVVREAESKWSPSDDGTGVLQFGVDVGRARDPLAIAERRGRKIRQIYAEVLGEEDHCRGVEILMGMVRERRRPHERRPRIVFDETGPEGSRFGKELRRYVAASKDPRDDVEIIGVQFGHPPRNRKLFDKRRDELTHGFAAWLKAGGAIPPDGELEAEIEATVGARVEVSYGASGMKWEVIRYVDNDTLRKTLGRSPNRLDACKLAVVDVDGDDVAPEEQRPEPVQAGASAPRSLVAAVETDDPDVAEFNPMAAADNALQALWGYQ